MPLYFYLLPLSVVIMLLKRKKIAYGVRTKRIEKMTCLAKAGIRDITYTLSHLSTRIKGVERGGGKGGEEVAII